MMNVDLGALERRERGLWTLALLLLVLLALGVFLTDTGQSGWQGPRFASSFFLLIIIVLICVYFYQKALAFRRDNRSLISSLSIHQRNLQLKTEQLNRWAEVSHALITNFDLDKLLDLIMRTALDVTEAHTGSLMLLDREAGTLNIAASHGLSPKIVRDVKVRLGEGIAGYVAQTGRPLLLHNDEPDPRVAQLLRRKEIGSAISVPLKIEQRVEGALNLNRSAGAPSFTEDDVETLTLFGSQAALAIEKARLYKQSQEQVAELKTALAELERAQAQLVQSEKLASIGLLAGGVAHEINNPLLVILGRTELLLMDAPQQRRKTLETIHSETQRIAEIVKSLLTFSRVSDLRADQKVDLNRALESTLLLTGHVLTLENVAIHKQFEPNLPGVQANLGQIQQVFTNLIINALHAMPGGGTLTLRTRHQNGLAQAEVEDTGCGIAPDHLSKIFDPFFTTKAEGKGTGLGLAVSYGIIQAHGGQIKVRSEPGQGTCFTVELPLVPGLSSGRRD